MNITEIFIGQDSPWTSGKVLRLGMAGFIGSPASLKSFTRALPRLRKSLEYVLSLTSEISQGQQS